MAVDFVTLLLKRIDSYNSFNRKVINHTTMINELVKNFNDIALCSYSLTKPFKFELNAFEKSNGVATSRYLYTIKITFWYSSEANEVIYIDVDLLNEDNYIIIFDKMFNVLLSYANIRDTISNVNLNKRDTNPFTTYLINNLKYLPNNVEYVNE